MTTDTDTDTLLALCDAVIDREADTHKTWFPATALKLAVALKERLTLPPAGQDDVDAARQMLADGNKGRDVIRRANKVFMLVDTAAEIVAALLASRRTPAPVDTGKMSEEIAEIKKLVEAYSTTAPYYGQSGAQKDATALLRAYEALLVERDNWKRNTAHWLDQYEKLLVKVDTPTREQIVKLLMKHLRLTLFEGAPCVEVPSLRDTADAILALFPSSPAAQPPTPQDAQTGVVLTPETDKTPSSFRWAPPSTGGEQA